MWDLPEPGLEPVSPALAGGFLTTVPPGKSQTYPLLKKEMGRKILKLMGEHCRDILGIFLNVFQTAHHDLFMGNDINSVGCFQHVFNKTKEKKNC